VPERAPSIVREDQPTFARVLAMIGVFLVVLGTLAMVLTRWGYRPVVTPTIGFVCQTVGVLLLIFHAFADREWQFRRLYSGLAILGIIGALILRVLPGDGGIGAGFPLFGIPALFLSLVFLIATVRHETEEGWRKMVLGIIALVAAALLVVPILVALFAPAATVNSWIAGEGALLLLLGLFYAGAYLALEGTDSSAAYYAGLVLGVIGLVAVGGGLVRSLIPESAYLVPAGLIVIATGVVLLVLAAGTCLDWPVIVLTRRELASYFYSPIAYLVLVGVILVGWYMFITFVSIILRAGARGSLFEPIIGIYIFGLIPVMVQTFIVPVLTMRLLAEEQRTGTLEVLLTAPVNEVTVVVSKFLASWIFYLILWLPWWVYLVSLRYFGGEEFDYRPVLSFTVALVAISAGFMSMGLFFSSLTRNQIIAAVLTFVGMIGLLATYLLKFQSDTPGSWTELLSYVSYLDLWWNSLEGTVAPRFLLFHISLTVFFLYLTTKVLEARKWK
jgi:ABC-type transport system involved in multi-copper enzyme maturation permease subunit